jgi:hypothetical protein
VFELAIVYVFESFLIQMTVERKFVVDFQSM